MSSKAWHGVLGMRLIAVTDLTAADGDHLGDMLTFAGEDGGLEHVKIFAEPARGGPELRVSVRDGLRAPEPAETARETADRILAWEPVCDGFLGG